MNQHLSLTTEKNQPLSYPVLGIAAALALIYLSPFLSSLLSYPAFIICAVRVIKYDEKVFAADYCLLAPSAMLFRLSSGLTFLVILVLAASLWYFVKRGLRSSWSAIILIVLLNYLILRFQMNVGKFLLCFGQLFMLFVLLPEQDKESAVRATKLFCIGVLLSCLYAFVFRNSHQLRMLLGDESQAIWGSGIMRFQGLMADANYFMTMPMISLALLVKLKDCDLIKSLPFCVLCVGMILFGVLSYSKTFLLVFVLFVLIYIAWQFFKKKYIYGMLFLFGVFLLGYVLLSSETSPFAVIFRRFAMADNISDLTTGRTNIYLDYIHRITETLQSFVFGAGFGAEYDKDPHNIYLEIAFYLGVAGLILFVGYFVALFMEVRGRAPGFKNQRFAAKYIVVIMILLLYSSLHGIFQVVTYAELFLMYMSFLIVKDEKRNRTPELECGGNGVSQQAV